MSGSRSIVADVLRRHGRALALGSRLADVEPRPILAACQLALHVVGLLTVGRLTLHWGWLMVLPVLLLAPAAIACRLRRPHLLVATLAPLVIVYALALVRVLLAVLAREAGGEQQRVPEPWGAWLDLRIGVFVAATWALLAQAGPLAEALGRRLLVAPALGRVIGGGSLAWAAVTYFGQRTHGAAAGDPYGYAQMAVDLSLRGTPLHTYPLVATVAGWSLTPEAAIPSGYGIVQVETGLASSAWPPGYSVLLALSFRVLGEVGLYILTPLVGVAALLAVWLLAREVARTWPRRWADLAASLAVLVVATSHQQVSWLLVPMADVPAQFFSTLAVLLALRSVRERPYPFAAAAGLCLGVAFALRYTQVLIAPALLVVWLSAAWCRRDARFVWGALLAGATAWIPAIPVLWFNQATFGSPFATGSAELHLFGVGSVGENLRVTAEDLLAPAEFLWLLPLVLFGCIVAAREHPRAVACLLVWGAVLTAFHLPYAALRLRDLLAELPILAVFAGIGAAALVRHREGWARWLGTAVLLAPLWLRTVPTLQATAPGGAFSGFGYVRPEQRAAFEEIGRVTAPNAIVAASLHSGAVGLYTDRGAVRPGEWADQEWLTFLARAAADGRDVYALVDGVAMARPLRVAEMHYAVERVARLSLPFFNADAGTEGQEIELVRFSTRNT